MKEKDDVKFEDGISGIDDVVKSEFEEMKGIMKVEVKMEESLSKDSSPNKLSPSLISQLIRPPVFQPDVSSLERRLTSSITG